MPLSRDMDLSLSGSPMATPNRRPGSGRLSDRKPASERRSMTSDSARKTHERSASHGAPSTSARRSSRDTPAEAGGDYMALFENSVKPKILKAKQHTKAKTTKPAWVTPKSSARSDLGSARGSQHSQFTHSVFQPSSVRSSSTYHPGDDGAETGRTEPTTDPVEELDLRFDDLALPDPAADQGHRPNGALHLPLNNARVTNNMTSQAHSPGNRTPLGEMENAFQNFKRKTPVNQVNRGGLGSPGHSVSSPRASARAQPGVTTGSQPVTRSPRDLTPEQAALRIQTWYRRYSLNAKRSRASEAAMRRMLATKRDERAVVNGIGDLVRNHGNNEDRRKVREDKARRARQAAIEELHKKREFMRQENERKTGDDVKFLQSSGKVSKKPATMNNYKNYKGQGARPKTNRPNSVSSIASVENPESQRSPRRIDDIFQDNNPRDKTTNVQAEEEGATGGSTTRTEAESQAQSKVTTLDDLMDTLKKLEADEKFGAEKPDKNEHVPSWLEDLEKTSSDHENLTSENLSRLQQPKDNLAKSGLLTDDKLRSIMSFLDEVETNERLDDIEQTATAVATEAPLVAPPTGLELRPAPLVPSAEELEQIEQASAVASEVTSQMLTQKLELEEKKRTVTMLQKALNQQRELTVRHAKETEKEMKQRLNVQKDEYEETVKRHLSFIDQLIDDKKTLSEKCETLVKELKTIDKKCADKVKVLQNNHEVEVRKIKEVQAAAEKLRREKWIDEKTKQIRERTVLGLEPEIKRLIAQHKSEMQKVKSIHEAELLASDERAGQRYIQMTEQLRDQLAHEKESACARERELARSTYEKQLQQEEEAFQQQRQRLYTEVREEKERLHSAASRQRAELDRLQRQLEDSHSAGATAMREEYEKARDEQERRHTAEIRQLREQLVLEKQAFEENYMKKQENWLMQKERELKENVRRERDKEIEMVLMKFEEDGQNSREECERLAENRIKRVRDKYEAEMSELERAEKQTMDKYNTAKARLAEVEGENERISLLDRQKDREILDLKKLLEKLNQERDSVSDIIRQEFADRIVATDEENKRVKIEISELKARHRVELDRARQDVDGMQRAKDDEMEEVHKRVKQAIQKKEEVVQQMRQQYQAAVKRADHLEGLLEQQRKQLLGKK